MGKHIKYGLLGLLVIGAGAISYFWNDIRVLMSLREYVQIFAPDKIDENFRNLYEKERSIQVPRSGPVYALNENLSADVLPETYDFEGETRNVRELLERSQTTGLAILHDGVLIHEEYNRGNTRESLAIQMS
ncbi:MAG: serine hydrolase, partial [Pseudomonadota bacterium]